MSAMNCFASGAWAADTTKIDVSIKSVQLQGCRFVSGQRTFCKYRADANISGAGPLGQIANSLMSQNVDWTCAEFGISQGRWEVMKSYIACYFDADGGVTTGQLVERPY